MKKLLLALVLGLSFGSAFPQAAHAQKLSVSAARAQIQLCYNRYEQAMKTRNLETINGLLAADYMMHTMAGRISDRNVTLNYDRFLFALPSQTTRYQTRITSIQPRGLDMIVMTELTMEATASSGTRTSKSKSISTYRDFWSPMRNSNGWVLRQSVELGGEGWLNGVKFG